MYLKTLYLMVKELGQTDTPRPSHERFTCLRPIFPFRGSQLYVGPFLLMRPFYVHLVLVFNGARIRANGHT